MKEDYYRTKAVLPLSGRLRTRIKVSSRLGETIEIGQSESINVQTGRKFMLSKIVTMAIFGHLKKTNKEAYQYLQSKSDDRDFIDQIGLRVKIIDYDYLYGKFEGQKRYKTINFKGKRYVQEWSKKGNRYVFSSRTRVKYDNRKRLTKLTDEYRLA